MIERVQGQKVTDADAALRALQAMGDGKHLYAAVLVARDGQRTWIPVALPQGPAGGATGGQDPGAGPSGR